MTSYQSSENVISASPENSPQKEYYHIIGEINGNLITLSGLGGSFGKGKLYLNSYPAPKYDQLNSVELANYKINDGFRYGFSIRVFIFNNRLYSLEGLIDKKDKRIHTILTQYDPSNLSKIKSDTIHSKKYTREFRGFNGDFMYSVSPDSSRLIIAVDNWLSRSDNASFDFYIYNSDLIEQNHYSKQFNLENDLISLYDMKINDSEDIALLFKEFISRGESLTMYDILDEKINIKFNLTTIHNGSWVSSDLPYNEKYVPEPQIRFIDNGINITGMRVLFDADEVKNSYFGNGLVIMNYKFDEKNFSSIEYQQLKDQNVKYNISGRYADDLNNEIKFFSGISGLVYKNHYSIKNSTYYIYEVEYLYLLGSTLYDRYNRAFGRYDIGFERVASKPKPVDLRRNYFVTYADYKDIVVIKVDNESQLAWVSLIPKRQIVAAGTSVSFESFTHNNDLYFYFTDNDANKKDIKVFQSGEFKSMGQNIHGFVDNRLANHYIQLVKMDEDGNIKRYALSDCLDKNNIINPKESIFNNNRIILYGKLDNKDQYHFIPINEKLD